MICFLSIYLEVNPSFETMRSTCTLLAVAGLLGQLFQPASSFVTSFASRSVASAQRRISLAAVSEVASESEVSNSLSDQYVFCLGFGNFGRQQRARGKLIIRLLSCLRHNSSMAPSGRPVMLW